MTTTAMTEPLINLCFHGIGRPDRQLEPGEDVYWITEDVFHGVLDLVAEDPRVRISFDDGNESDIALGLPALLQRRLHGTFFVLAGRLDQDGSLSSDQVSALVSAGMTIGSHGMDHVPWRGLGEARCRRELVEARTRLETVTGAPVEEAALPLGRYDRRLIGRIRGLGYSRLHTSDRRWADPDAWMQPRFSLRRTDTVESVRREVLTRAALPQRLRDDAVGLVKRWR
jgi:peptidoglycan/xylan/chitin deacetylase (PgdA/CDA1 family)